MSRTRKRKSELNGAVNKHGQRIVAGDEVAYARPGSVLDKVKVLSVVLVEGEHEVYNYTTHQYEVKLFTRTEAVVEVKKRRYARIVDATAPGGVRWEHQEYMGKKSLPIDNVAKLAVDDSKIP